MKRAYPRWTTAFVFSLLGPLAAHSVSALQDSAGHTTYEIDAPLPLTGPLAALRTPWHTVLENVREQGKFNPADELPGYYGLEDHRGNSNSNHEADYINLRGSNGTAGFRPSYAELSSENWRRRADGGWDVDQWLFETSLDGTVKHVSHRMFREDKNGIVHPDDIRYDLSSMSDPRIRSTLDALIHRWYLKTSAPPH